MKSTVLKLDSSQFNTLLSKVDTLIKSNLDTNHNQVSNNTVFSNPSDDSSSFWLLFLRYLIAPAIIVFISVWVTTYSNRSKEYNRIIKLNDFISVWLNNIIAGINEQIQLFANLRNTYNSIEYDTPRNFAYANVDIKSLIDLPKADLHKLFISIRVGNDTLKSQNLYDLLFALNSANQIIEEYKEKTPELNMRTIKLSDDGFHAYKQLLDVEKEYANFHIQAQAKNAAHLVNPTFLVSQKYIQSAIDRQNYLNTPVGKTRTRRAVYFFSKKQADFCAKNLQVGDQYLFQLLELNSNVSQAIFQLKEYYSKIRKNIDTKIADMVRMRGLISSNQTFFNNPTFVSKLKFKE